MNRNRLLTALAVVCAAAVAAPVHGTEQQQSTTERMQEGASDLWIDGKLETVYALNEYLNPFDIDTDVNNGVVRLTGSVESEVHRDLATDLARGVEGVRDVDNQLKVEPESERTPAATTTQTNTATGTGTAMHEADHHADPERNFGQWVSDTTTTAKVKSKLLADDEVAGLDIDVDTMRDVVTLRGDVDSEAQRNLAVQIAAETDGVAEVRNELKVRDELASRSAR